MIVEQAQVIAVEGDYVLLQTVRQSTCDNCSVNKGCGSAVLSKLVGKRFMQMKVLNAVDAKLGDTVSIGMQESGLLKSALLVYALPLLCIPFFIGVAGLLSSAPLTDGLALLAALAGLLCGVGAARFLSARLAQNPAFYPVILRIEQSGSLAGPAVLAP